MRQRAHWQQQLVEAYHNGHSLLRDLSIPLESVEIDPDSHFPIRVPRFFASLMKPGDPNDPLLRQVLPLQAETHEYPDFVSDPVGDLTADAGNGFIHKYASRILLISHPACAVHCRYCFRRHFPYAEKAQLPAIEAIKAYLDIKPNVDEIILSGGDPLSLPDGQLISFLSKLETLSQIHTIRIHSRFPVVIPDRLTDELIVSLNKLKKKVVLVLHINHPNEISPLLTGKLSRLRITLLNQSVLLRGINDSVSVLAALSRGLFDARILPYYLHQLDRVQGAAHFEVPIETGKQIMHELKTQIPGYLTPRYVLEQSGKPNKTWIA